MSNVKAGDLAMIVRPQSPNYRRIVTVVRAYGGEEIGGMVYAPSPCSIRWVVESQSPLVIYSTRHGEVLHERVHVCRDTSLRRITPPAGTVSDSEVTELFKSDTAPMVTKEAAA